jgi:hypothetical protein
MVPDSLSEGVKGAFTLVHRKGVRISLVLGGEMELKLKGVTELKFALLPKPKEENGMDWTESLVELDLRGIGMGVGSSCADKPLFCRLGHAVSDSVKEASIPDDNSIVLVGEANFSLSPSASIS